MAVTEMLGNLLQGNSIFLFLGLIVLFIIAYKILKLIIQTSIVVVLSGVFYIVLRYLGLDLELSLSNVLLFMFLGGLLFVVYSMLFLVASGTYKVFSGLSKIIKKPLERRKRKKKEKEIKDKQKEKQEEEKDSSSEKEVVLKEFKEEMKNE